MFLWFRKATLQLCRNLKPLLHMSTQRPVTLYVTAHDTFYQPFPRNSTASEDEKAWVQGLICVHIFTLHAVFHTQAARKRIESESSESNQGLLQRWFPGWISGYQAQMSREEGGGKGTENDTNTKPESAVVEQPEEVAGTGVPSVDEGELLDELGYEADHDNVFLRDRIFLTLAFTLGGGSFQLVTTPLSKDISCLGPEPLVEFRFVSLRCAADVRPRLRYASYDLSLGSLTVQDHVDSESLFPVLVQAKGAEVRFGMMDFVLNLVHSLS